jgi:Bacteriocin-protection, YdeI or OmpD-Associated/Domain of unknown function (DUF1905)
VTRPAERTWTFTATIGRLGILYIADVPVAVSRALGAARVPIVAEVNGAEPLRTMLNPRGGGRHALYLNGTVRRQAGATKEGAKVKITLRLDEEPLVRATPDDLARALAEEGVRAAWDGMTRSNKNEILRWIDAAAHEATRAKRIVKAVERALVAKERAEDRALLAKTRRPRKA